MDEDLFAEKLLKTLAQTGFAIVAFFAVAFAAVKFDINTLPIVGHAEEAFYQAERIADGVPPYVSHFEPRPPLGFLLTGSSLIVGKRIGLSDILSSRIPSALALFGCVYLVQCLAFRFTRRIAPALVAGMALLACPHFIQSGLMGNEPHIYFVFFLLLALLARTSRRSRWTGAAAMAAALCWQPAGILVMLLLVHSICRTPDEHGWKRAFYDFLVGAAIPLGLCLGYHLVTGSLGALWEQAVYFPARFLLEFVGGPSSLLANWQGASHGGTGLLLWVAAAVGFRLLLARLKIWSYPPGPGAVLAKAKGWGAFVGSSIFLALCVTYLHRDAFDLLPLAPVVALAAGLCVSLVDRELRRIQPLLGLISGSLVALAALIGSLTLVAKSPLALAREMKGKPSGLALPYRLPEQEALAESVGALFAEGTTVYALGPTHLLGILGAENWSRYGLVFPAVDDHVWKETGAKFTPELDGELPEVILLSRCDPNGSEKWLKAYEPFKLEGAAEQGIRALRLKR